jgi:hypothetical protein
MSKKLAMSYLGPRVFCDDIRATQFYTLGGARTYVASERHICALRSSISAAFSHLGLTLLLLLV